MIGSAPEGLFKDIEYFFLGDRNITVGYRLNRNIGAIFQLFFINKVVYGFQEVEKLLKEGGAKKALYKTKSVTHFICDDADQIEYEEARDLFKGKYIEEFN